MARMMRTVSLGRNHLGGFRSILQVFFKRIFWGGELKNYKEWWGKVFIGWSARPPTELPTPATEGTTQLEQQEKPFGRIWAFWLKNTTFPAKPTSVLSFLICVWIVKKCGLRACVCGCLMTQYVFGDCVAPDPHDLHRVHTIGVCSQQGEDQTPGPVSKPVMKSSSIKKELTPARDAGSITLQWGATVAHGPLEQNPIRAGCKFKKICVGGLIHGCFRIKIHEKFQ